MTNSNRQISAEDARAALASIAAANKTTTNNMRPPLWLVLLCAISFGITTTAMGLMINNGLWHSIQWGAYIVCCLSVVAWIVTLWIKGIRVKITDINIAKKGVIAALLICVLLVSARVIYLQTGVVLFPCIAGVLNAAVLAYALHFNVRLNVQEKNKNNE